MSLEENFRKIPGVDIILNQPETKELIHNSGREAVVHSIQKVIKNIREKIKKNKTVPSMEVTVSMVKDETNQLLKPSLKPVINATGIILHTNLGRAPLGEKIFEDISNITKGYSNLEFNLKTGKRGQRNSHISGLLEFLTGAEQTVVVNNNAAGIILALNTFAKRKEVIISRGELIEIGGAFRIPDIMKSAEAKMVEVGTTNKTRLSDYENAITDKTAIIFKAHQSNFSMQGFTEEVSVKELAEFAHSKGLMFIYDIGSGLLRKPKGLDLKNEPDVKSSVKDGADLVTFSGDKLLGGPQAGIIAGKSEYVSKLAKAPLMRALRVGKLTISSLWAACRNYMNTEDLIKNNNLFKLIERPKTELTELATKLKTELSTHGINSKIIDSNGQCGGGTLPGLSVKSYAVEIISEEKSNKANKTFYEKTFYNLLKTDRPILGVLREGKLIFDVLTIFDKDIKYIAASIKKAMPKM